MTWAIVLAIPTFLLGPVDLPEPTPAVLDQLLERMRSPRSDERRVAAEAILRSSPSALTLFVERLHRPRAVPAASLRRVVLETWAQVPNPEYPQKGEMWLQKVEKVRRGKRLVVVEHDPDKVDLLAALDGLDLDGNEALAALPDRAMARAEAMEAVALLRRLASTGARQAVDPIFDFAFVLDGVFRDECGRALRGMGGVAVPGLIKRARATGKGTGKQRRWAMFQLDRMDRARPAKAIATAEDDRLRAEIIRAYGEVRALDAVEAILDQLDASNHRVRDAARWAWARYVVGPPPPPSPKRKRKLPGGKEETEEKEDYLNYRDMAILALQKALTEVHDGEKINSVDAEQMTRELLAHHDRKHAGAWQAERKAALDRRAAGDLPGAAAAFGAILAQDPFVDRRREMADVFLSLGDAALERRDEGAALEHLSIGLALSGEDRPAALARLEVLRGHLAERAGRRGAPAYRRALALDPSCPAARLEVDRLPSTPSPERWPRITLIAAAATSAALLVAAALVLARAIRARRRPSG